MSAYRRTIAVGSILGSILVAGGDARAEFAIFLTSEGVIAVDLADDTVVSRYGIPAEVGTSVKGLARGAGYYLVDSEGRRVWTVDDGFKNPSMLIDLPAVNVEGITRHQEAFVVNGQAPEVPPDTLFVVDDAGSVLERFPVPLATTNLKDLASDGTHLWGIDAAEERLWRIDPGTGAFELSHPLPGPLIFAVAWNDATAELWVFQSAQGNDVVGYTIDRTTGMATEALRVEKAGLAFVLAAAFSDTVTPSLVTSWSAVKARYSP